MSKVSTYHKLIEKELLSINFANRPVELYEPMKYVLEVGGKRMRPLLTLLACDLFGGSSVVALPAALAIELFHNFSLVHDDIMDRAPLRRNRATVHEKWNNNVAILSGDALLIKALQQFEKLPSELMTKVLPVFNMTALKVCEGQQFDMNYEKLTQVSIAEYVRMIELKTAVLLAGGLQIGALIGNATTEDAGLIYEFGRSIGIAFQLQDDLLDIYADPEKFGKQPGGGNIIANKKDILLIKAMEMATLIPYKREELLHWIKATPVDPMEKVAAVKNIYDTLHVRSRANEEMNRYYEKGLEALDRISVEKEKKKDLYGLVERLRIREV